MVFLLTTIILLSLNVRHNSVFKSAHHVFKSFRLHAVLLTDADRIFGEKPNPFHDESIVIESFRLAQVDPVETCSKLSLIPETQASFVIEINHWPQRMTTSRGQPQELSLDFPQ